MMQHPLLRNNERGAAAIELALTLPILVLLIWGIFQISLLYEANAGMQHALGEGARLATLYDTTTTNHVPPDPSIEAKMNAKLFGQSDGAFDVRPVDSSNIGYKILTIKYTRNMNFLFFQGPAVTLTRTKQVYTVS